jgi:phosphoenolpyruvate carboxykinase (GTP)
MASETTAAAVGAGRRRAPRLDGDEAVLRLQLRRLLDALAQLRKKLKNPPKIYHVNWFRQDKRRQVPVAGLRRQPARALLGHRPLRIGFLPRPEDIDLKGLALSNEALHQLLDLDASAWHAEIDDIGRYLEGYGKRTPPALREKYQQVKRALG